uniref:C-type lectin domain-containing protein n=1 Tax=Steinernema glaseri TaxID=37863 RepID=A0A1I7Z3X3_9BILA
MILLTLLPLLLSLAFARKGCPPGALLSRDENSCYTPMFYNADFHTAEKTCVAAGGHLASLHTRYDCAYLIDYEHLYWLGGRDLYNNDTWTWTDGSPFNFNNWEAGGNVDGDDCLLMDGSTALWQPHDCQKKYNFICESASKDDLPNTSPQTTTTSTNPPTTTVPFCSGGNRTCIDGHCYEFVECTLTWEEALKNCKEMNGDLASIHNSQVEQLVEQFAYINATQSAWIWTGGKFDDDDVFRWSDGSDTADYQHWRLGYPFAQEGSPCVFVSSGGWENAPCDIDQMLSVCSVPK